MTPAVYIAPEPSGPGYGSQEYTKEPFVTDRNNCIFNPSRLIKLHRAETYTADLEGVVHLPMDKENSRHDGSTPRSANSSASLIAWLFLLYALPMVGFLAIALPPFQVPDEFHHAARAEQVSRGIFISPRLGGNIDGALYAFGELYESMHFHDEVKHTAETARAAASLNWGMQDHDKNFQNTAQYGPLLYLPQALGIWVGKLIGLNPVWTILETRLLNGLVATMVGFFAIRICRRGQALLFTALLLPMTMSEFGSVSQDALIISLSLFAIALASRILAEERPSTVCEFSFFVAIVVITTLGRPSQVAMAPLGFAFVGAREKLWLRKAVIAAIGVICIAGWMVMLSKLIPTEPPGASISGQFREMISHPLLLPTVAFRSIFSENSWWLFESVVGRLGWLDTPMPPWYTWAAAGALGCALVVPNRSPWLFPALIGSITLAAVVVTICAALYMSWTSVGRDTIDGLQGRYALSILPLLAWLTPVYPSYFPRLCSPIWIVVGAFPLVSLATLPGVIMVRFYRSWSDMALVLNILFFG